ncbi:MAG: hypothetical protein F4X57_00240 [Chloroflexi bacterium]|nr:hypothetical protein [Chloroflexota bacterium]
MATATVGTDKLTYELAQDFPKLPDGEDFAVVSTVATDSQNNLYVFQRKDPPVVVFDSNGNYLNAWGHGAFNSPHGMSINGDVVYLTDRDDSVAVAFTLEGSPLMVLGERGVHSDTGCEKPGDLVPRAAGPFNYPTEIVKGPSGSIYVADGYRNSRIHKFTDGGELVNSWGTPGSSEPGEFHLPHSLMVDDDEKVYVCDRTNRRIQIFDSEGEFITEWTGMGGPNDIAQGADGLFYICEQEADGNPPYVTIRDGEGEVLARWGIRHAHGIWVDSRGDIYVGLTTSQSVDKYVRV